MNIKRFIGGALESNGFVIYDKEGGEAFILDPGYEPNKFIEEAQRLGLKVKGILLTHHHYDHVGGVDKIRNFFDCPVYIHMGDTRMYKAEAEWIEEGQEFFIGEEKIVTIHTPGHSKGSVCYFSEKSKLSFTGDTIFNVDIGRTDLPGGSQREMEESIHKLNGLWSNEIIIYPGHGDSCNMKYVRNHNQEFLDIIND